MDIKAKLVRASLGFLLLFCVRPAAAQDVRIPGCTAVQACTLTPAGGIPWASGNLTFIFRPSNPHNSIYIFVHNLNPTSSHSSQTIQVFQTPFSQDIMPTLSVNTDGWTQDTVTQNGTAGASCNNVNAKVTNSPGASGLGTCYVTTMFAAQVAIRISGAATASGSPDNFDLAIVQETGSPQGQAPGGASGSLSTTNSGPSATNALQVVSDGTSRAFDVGQGFASPIAGTILNNLNANNGARTLYLDKVVVTSTGAGTIGITLTQNAGSSCAAQTPTNLKVGSSVASGALTNNSCSVVPTPIATGNPILLGVPAGGTVVFDARGIIIPSGTTFGVDAFVSGTAITGTATVVFIWYEQ